MKHTVALNLLYSFWNFAWRVCQVCTVWSELQKSDNIARDLMNTSWDLWRPNACQFWFFFLIIELWMIKSDSDIYWIVVYIILSMSTRTIYKTKSIKTEMLSHCRRKIYYIKIMLNLPCATNSNICIHNGTLWAGCWWQATFVICAVKINTEAVSGTKINKQP